MAINTKDKTVSDDFRTDLNFFRSEVDQILPEYFTEDHKKLINLLDEYYGWMDSDQNPNDRINQLYTSRDATRVPLENLSKIEDELLLGEAYFGGFLNKREAIKFSNFLYRSKGTKYSVEQFFRAFFGEDVLIEFPKDNVFIVGPRIDFDAANVNSAGEQVSKEASEIGAESRSFITNDKLYQMLSILITSQLPISVWEDVYKLFVHPAGVFLASVLVIESFNANEFGALVGVNTIQPAAGTALPTPIVRQSVGAASMSGVTQVTKLLNS